MVAFGAGAVELVPVSSWEVRSQLSQRWRAQREDGTALLATPGEVAALDHLREQPLSLAGRPLRPAFPSPLRRMLAAQGWREWIKREASDAPVAGYLIVSGELERG
jgi:hypothetical protein